MNQLHGDYAQTDQNYDYVGRVFPIKAKGKTQYRDGLNQKVEVKDGDILKVAGNGTWFAHYQKRGI